MLITTATELPRLIQCIGSRAMPRSLPKDHDKQATDEGNAAHWLAEQIIDGSVDPRAGLTAPNGHIVTDDMIEHVRTYISNLDFGEVERDTTHAGTNWQINGRADHIQFRDNELTVDDFKYGWGIVSPVENWTLISHAIGWIKSTRIIPAKITMRIHQPRPYHQDGPVRSWTIDYNKLLDFSRRIDNRLENPPELELVTGPLCRKCHALPTCNAAREASVNAIDVATTGFTDEIANDVLSHQYEMMERAKAMIEARFDAVKELMTHRVKTGEVIEGYALESRYAQRRWKTGSNPDFLKVVTGKDLSKDGLVTPAEAERRGVDPATVKAFTERPMIGSKLTKIDVNAKAAKYFGSGERS